MPPPTGTLSLPEHCSPPVFCRILHLAGVTAGAETGSGADCRGWIRCQDGVGTRAEGEGVSTVSGAGTSSGVVESCDGGDSGNKSVDETG